jgi:hypothetical protein
LYEEDKVKKVISLTLIAAFIMSLAFVAACAKGAKKGEGLVGTWAMVDSPAKVVKITKEGEQYFYEGSQGKSPATKQDENTLLVAMGPIQVTVKLDPASGILTVSFMGENYKYKRTQ